MSVGKGVGALPLFTPTSAQTISASQDTKQMIGFSSSNPNPDLTRHTFGRERCFAGVTYPELISSIVRSALERQR